MMRRQIVFVTPLDADSALMLRINGKHLALPIAPSVVVGRLPYATDVLDRRPHVDLSAFDAQHQGVSLEHLEISRKQGLVYATDLDSSSGTQLNSLWLRPYAEHVLRRGDTFRLGGLHIDLIFPNSPAPYAGAPRICGVTAHL